MGHFARRFDLCSTAFTSLETSVLFSHGDGQGQESGTNELSHSNIFACCKQILGRSLQIKVARDFQSGKCSLQLALRQNKRVSFQTYVSFSYHIPTRCFICLKFLSCRVGLFLMFLYPRTWASAFRSFGKRCHENPLAANHELQNRIDDRMVSTIGPKKFPLVILGSSKRRFVCHFSRKALSVNDLTRLFSRLNLINIFIKIISYNCRGK